MCFLGAGVEEGVLGELVGKVYGVLEAGGLLGRHFRYRSQVLRAVFRLVDREHGPLLAAIARVMLAVSLSFQHTNQYSVVVSLH